MNPLAKLNTTSQKSPVLASSGPTLCSTLNNGSSIFISNNPKKIYSNDDLISTLTTFRKEFLTANRNQSSTLSSKLNDLKIEPR